MSNKRNNSEKPEYRSRENTKRNRQAQRRKARRNKNERYSD